MSKTIKYIREILTKYSSTEALRRQIQLARWMGDFLSMPFLRNYKGHEYLRLLSKAMWREVYTCLIFHLIFTVTEKYEYIEFKKI